MPVLQAAAKRGFDLLLSSLGILILSPVLVIIAAAIRFTSSGPILFRQTRIGRRLKPFQILKFRTMVENAPQLGPPLTAGDDPRITRIGKVLRKTKLDELPQLINVIKGDMSLVGPRPEVPKYVEMFRDDFERILIIRPGLTDLASIKYRDESVSLEQASDPEHEYITRVLPDKIALAKEYVNQSSLWMDFRLIVLTLMRVLR